MAKRLNAIRTLGLVVAATSLLSLVGVQPAAAHLSGVRADNRDHAWCYTASTDGKPLVRDAMANAMNNLARQTSMTENGPNPCTDLTDVRFFENDAFFNGRANRGLWRCVDINESVSPAVCRSANVSINRDLIRDNGGPFEINLRKTSCHEVGHSVGLAHHEAFYDCMVSGRVDTSRQLYADGHINQVEALF